MIEEVLEEEKPALLELPTIDVTQEIINNLVQHRSKLSYSSLSQFKESPAAFINYKLGKQVTTDAMRYGQIVHCLVLEPEDFQNRYHVIDDTAKCLEIGGAKPRATNKYKEWINLQRLSAGEKSFVSPDHYKHAKVVADSVRFNRSSAKLLNGVGENEVDIEWAYKNFLFKGIIDRECEEFRVDLKTVPDADPGKVARLIVANGHHIQAAMYATAKGYKPHYIIASDSAGGVSTHLLDQELVQYGMDEYDKLMTHFNDCVINDRWGDSYDFWSKRIDGTYRVERPKWTY